MRVNLLLSCVSMLECFRLHSQFTRNEAGTLFDCTQSILEILDERRVRANDDDDIEVSVSLALSQTSKIKLRMNKDKFFVFVMPNCSLSVQKAYTLYDCTWSILSMTDFGRIRRNPRTWEWEMAIVLDHGLMLARILFCLCSGGAIIVNGILWRNDKD